MTRPSNVYYFGQGFGTIWQPVIKSLLIFMELSHALQLANTLMEEGFATMITILLTPKKSKKSANSKYDLFGYNE